jgi:hypothetical protein
MFKKFMSTEGETLYRPTPVMAGYMAQDKLAHCAGCTQNHEGVAFDAYRALCSDCGQNQVFGYLNFNKIA